jgi:hypothetical protein
MCIPASPCANCGEAQPCTMASNMVCCAESFRSCHLSACAHQRRCIRVFWGFRSLYTGTTYACGPARPVTASTTGPGSHQPRLKPVIVNPVETHTRTHAHARARTHARTHAHHFTRHEAAVGWWPGIPGWSLIHWHACRASLPHAGAQPPITPLPSVLMAVHRVLVNPIGARPRM